MNITKDVIRDLLPVYLAGDASQDTRTLVEQYLAQDEELKRDLEAARAITLDEPSSSDLALLGNRSLDLTRQLLARKNWLVGLSIFLTLLPLSFAHSNGRLAFLMLRDQPVLSAVALCTGIAGWFAYLHTCWRMRATALEPAPGWRRRILWTMTGFLIGTTAGLMLEHWTGWRFLAWLPILTGVAAVAIGEWVRQISTGEKANRPTTLFS